MPWQVRGNKRYYYRSVATPDGPRRVYVGTGAAGEAAAATDELRRRERQRNADRFVALQAEISETLSPVEELDQNLDLLTHATLLACGYHQRRCNEWRRRRYHAKHGSE